ncbi:zinc finger, RING/FYVE/PHD-type containing protein [Tanacetum coccineum]
MVLEIVTSMVLLFVGISVLVIIHLCIANRVFGMTQDNIEVSTVVQRSNTLSEDDIKKLPLYYYNLDQKVDAEDMRRVECAVCLEGFRGGDKCILLPNCRHNFHANCIESWLIRSAACPICRTCVDLERSQGKSTFSGDGSDGEELQIANMKMCSFVFGVHKGERSVSATDKEHRRGFKSSAHLQRERNGTILDWPPSHDLERKRSPCYYKASKLLPQDTVALPHWGSGLARLPTELLEFSFLS